MRPAAQSFSQRWTQRQRLLVLGVAALMVLLLFVALTTGLMDAANAVIAKLRDVGPVAFFVAMALLPAVGFPMMAFTFAVGPVFGPTMGTGGVIACSLLAVVINLLLTFWLANRALRPLVSRLLIFFDFHLPENSVGNPWQLALIVRLAPGPPYWVQGYLLGVMGVPFVAFMVVSTLVSAGHIVAIVCGGAAIAHANARFAFVAVGVVVTLVAALHLLRRQHARRRALAALNFGGAEIVALKRA